MRLPASWHRWADRTGLRLALHVVAWLMRRHHAWMQWEPGESPWCARCEATYPCPELNRLDSEMGDLNRRLEESSAIPDAAR